MLDYKIRELRAMDEGGTEILLGAHINPEHDAHRLVVNADLMTWDVRATVVYPCAKCGWEMKCGYSPGEDCHS